MSGYNLDNLWKHISELESKWIYESDKRMLLTQLAIAMELRGIRRVLEAKLDPIERLALFKLRALEVDDGRP